MLTGEHAVAVAGDEPALKLRLWRTLSVPQRLDFGLVLGLTALLAVPVVVALIALRSPRWFPLVDMAQIEMRVRDVPTTHPPLLGLGGRIRGYGHTGSHPGPLAFYLLWPVYWLLGGSSWAFQVSAATLSLVAAGLAVWIGHRRGGATGAVAIAAVLALLLRSYGAVMVTEPWNPRLPVVWWVVCLLAVWSVLAGDLVLLPLVVLAGTFCVQTHIPYALLVGGLWLLTAAVLVRRRRTLERRQVLPAAGLFALVWLPPLVEQLVHRPGNLAIIVQNFRHPYDTRPPLAEARDLWLRHLDVTAFLRGDMVPVTTPARGLLFLAVWAASVAVAWRRRAATLLALHAVVGTALVLGAVAVSRIFGPLWPYLLFWAWGTTALMAFAAGWTFTSAPSGELRWPRATVATLGAAGLLAVGLFAVKAPDTEMAGADLSATLSELAGPTLDRLRDDPAGCGDGCRYFVSWVDPVDLGSLGYGMVLELERSGFVARTDPYEGEAVRFHRTTHLDQTDAEVHVAIGDNDIRAWQLRDDAEQLAIVDFDTPADRAEFRHLREELLLDLHAHGLHDLAQTAATTDPIEIDPRMSPEAQQLVHLANHINRPTAVFLRIRSDS